MCTVPDGAQWTRVEGIVQLIPTMKSIGADKQENKASKSNEAEKCDQIATKEEKIDFSNVKIEPLFEEEVELVGKTLIAITNLPPRAMMGIESCGMLLSAVNNLKDSEDEELHLLMVDNHIPAGAKLY